MNYFTIFTLCVTIAMASAWPQRQFGGNPFLQNQFNQQSPSQFNPGGFQNPQGSQFNPGFPNQGQPNQGQFNQGFPNQGQFNQGSPNQGQFNQGSPNQGPFNQGFPNQGQFNQGSSNQGQFNQGSPNQGQFNQGFPNQGQFVPNPNNPFFSSTLPNTVPDISTVGTQGIINQQGQFQNPTQNQVTATTPAAFPAQSPAFLRCTRDECLATNEYNPVCGSDNISYNNERKLDCANQCGRRLTRNWTEVTVSRRGSCASGQRVS